MKGWNEKLKEEAKQFESLGSANVGSNTLKGMQLLTKE